MAFWYYKYKTDYGNTIVDKSKTPFTLGANENQVHIDYDINSVQPVYLYRYDGSNIVINSEYNVKHYNDSMDGTPYTVPFNTFTGYTGTTAPATYVSKAKFNPYSASTLANINTRLLIATFNTFTGATISDHNSLQGLQGGTTNEFYHLTAAEHTIAQNTSGTNSGDETTSRINALYGYVPASNAALTGYTGTTVPATYLDKVNFNLYSGSTTGNVNNRLLTTIFNTFTGTTAPVTYVGFGFFNGYTASTATKINSRLLTSAFDTYSANTLNLVNGKLGVSAFNTYSGTTLSNINTRLLITSFNTYSGTTVPATYLSKSNFNTYSGTTLININTRLVTSAFNTYSGVTLTNINTRLLKSTFNTYTGSTSAINTSNNGLTRSGSNVHLGGTLTGSTTIGLGTVNLSFTGTTGTLRYGSDLSANYATRSLVDKGFVTGITTTLLTKSAFTTYSGTTEPATYLSKISFNSYTGSTSAISTANNGITRAGTNIHLGGALTGATQIGLASNNIVFTATTGTLRYGSDLSGSYNIRSLVDRGYVTGITSTLLTTSAFNTYSGATATLIGTKLATSAFNTYSGATISLINTKVASANNGVTKAGTNIHLGGALTGSTQIGMAANSITFTATTGTLRYGSDLSANYVTRSLVDKGFVTGITSTHLSISSFNTYSGVTGTRLGVIENNYVTGATSLGGVQTLVGSKLGKNLRFKGLVAGLNVTLTPTASGITISSTGGGGSGTTYMANNGIKQSTVTFGLGGTLTGDTTIGLGTNNLTFTGASGSIRYGSDVSGSYTIRSLVDKAYVTGVTSTIYTLSTIEVNIGNVPRKSGHFLITGLTVTTGKAVYIQQANGPYTNKGTLDDETEMDMMVVTGKVFDPTTIKCFWNSDTKVKGNFKFNYKVSS